MNDQLPTIEKVPTISTNTTAIVLAPENMNSISQFADFMSQGKTMLPSHLQGKPADCMAVVIQAMQWNMNPFAVAQKTHIVSGSLGYEAQLVNAVISSSTAIQGRFHYEYSDDSTWTAQDDPAAWVKVGAVLRGEKDIQWGEPLYPCKVTTKNSPLWKTAPKQQASYLALKYWSRLYTPAVILGVYTSDELQEKQQNEIDITPAKQESALSRPAKDDSNTDTDEVVASTDETVIEATGEVVVDRLPVADIIKAIEDSTTIEQLNAAKEDGEKWDSGTEEFSQMATAYQGKKAVLNHEAANAK